MAVGVQRYLRDQGVRVPEDVSVGGFDNIRLPEFCSPALTTAHIPRDRIGKTIFEILVSEKTRERPGGQEILIDPELVVRESTGAPKG
jgi:DNA-binding LacI/PurR family transcriptional regulator